MVCQIFQDTRNIPYENGHKILDPEVICTNKLNVVTGAFGIQSNNGYKFEHQIHHYSFHAYIDQVISAGQTISTIKIRYMTGAAIKGTIRINPNHEKKILSTSS